MPISSRSPGRWRSTLESEEGHLSYRHGRLGCLWWDGMTPIHFKTKFVNTSRVYQSTPKPFGCASRIDPKMVRKSPPPDICQRILPAGKAIGYLMYTQLSLRRSAQRKQSL